MITIGSQVRTMTGKTGVVIALRRAPEIPAALVRVGPLVMRFPACDRAAVIDWVRAYYAPDDLTIIPTEAPLCSSPSM